MILGQIIFHVITQNVTSSKTIHDLGLKALDSSKLQ